jgi:hypothetical protein
MRAASNLVNVAIRMHGRKAVAQQKSLASYNPGLQLKQVGVKNKFERGLGLVYFL